MKLVDGSCMAAIDRSSQERFAIPGMLLMEDAGIKGYLLLKETVWRGVVPQGRKVFVAGRGNNGGDALVMARQCFLDGFHDVAVVLAGGKPQERSASALNLDICQALGIDILGFPEQSVQVDQLLCGAEWIFDGIAGTGLQGALRSPLRELVSRINALPTKVVAIDVPSGIGDGFKQGFPAVEADVTLTMGLPKRCLFLPHARRLCGTIHVVAVGFPPSLLDDPSIPGELIRWEDFRGLLPPLAPDVHKNKRGHLAVFAGSVGTTGAAWLSAHAGARARTGLATLFASLDIYPLIAGKFSSVMVRPWDPGSEPGMGVFDPGRFTGLLVGPGWGTSEAKERWLEHFIGVGLPGILDADGITILKRLCSRGKLDLGNRWVLTPHPGEFSRLTGISVEEVLEDPVPRILELAAALNAHVVLKGHVTCAGFPDGRYWIMDGMNPALATGGSGDVLSGIVGGFVASGIEPSVAARLGVLLHARIGERAFRESGWFLAEDLLPLISTVLKEAGVAADEERI